MTTTKILDKTISDIFQDNPAVEYVDPQQNPIALRERDPEPDAQESVKHDAKNGSGLELVFNQTHNGIACALCPTAKRAHDRAWFTAKQIENWSGMSKMTLNRRLNKLEEVGRINGVSDLIHCEMPISNGGYQSVTLYNLNVLNQLAMVELDCDVLNETAKKFSDILSEVETTGSYSIQKPLDSYMIEDPIERAKRWIEEQAEKKRIEAERNAALEAESLAKEASQQSFKARATAMGRLSNIADREYLAHMTETVCKKQLGILRPSRYKAEHLMGTPWMRSCFRADAYKPLRRWLTSMASRRVTARLASELSMKTGDASELRELYVEAKLYGVDFDALAEEHGYTDVRKAQKILASCVAVIDRYECNKGDGEAKTCPICGYSPEIWGETLNALADSSAVGKWLRDDTTVDELEWWIAEKANENYGLQTI